MARKKSKRITSAEIDLRLAVLTALCRDPDSELSTPVGGFTAKKLAAMIGCSEAAICKRTTRALLKCRNKLPAEMNPNN